MAGFSYAACVSGPGETPETQDDRRNRDADAGDGRREPILGGVDHLDFNRPTHQARIAPATPRWPWLLAAVALLLVLVGVFRQPLADRLWPQTRAQELRTQAAQALAQGRLTAADGSGARELYEAALAIDPDRDDAGAGLMQVATAALAQARRAARADRFAEAHAALQLAQALSAPRAEVVPVEAELRTRETAHAGIPGLLARAEAARIAGKLVGDGAALPLYQRILALQPENNAALEGREDALGELLQQARTQLRSGELAQATASIELARNYDPGHVDLPDTQARLNEELDDVRRQAANDLRSGRLERATERYRLLAEAGQQADADAGIERVASAYAQRAETLASDFRFAAADTALQQARTLAPKLASLPSAEAHVARVRQAHARIGNRLPPHERARKVAQLLVEASAAEARGDLLTPPGDSAFDKLRAARAIAPDDPAVRRASARLLPAARQCFERELRNNNLARARACLDARAVVDGNEAGLAQARRRLAQRWLAVGHERLGAGELRGASAALASARELDPATPGLVEFEHRMRTALAPTSAD